MITDFTVKKRIERPKKRREMTPILWMNRSQGAARRYWPWLQNHSVRSSLQEHPLFWKTPTLHSAQPAVCSPRRRQNPQMYGSYLVALEVLPYFPLTKKRERLKTTPLALKTAEPVHNYSRCKDAYGSERSHWKLEHPAILCLVTIHTWEVYQHVCQYLDSNVVLFVWTEGAA